MTDNPLPFYVSDKFNLLNNIELTLYHQLKEAAPRYHVFTQVSLSQLFYIKSQHAFNVLGHVDRKSVDFVLCRPDTSIVMAVELNGPFHQNPEQIASDEVKRQSLKQAGIPLLVLYPKNLLTIKELRAVIASHIVLRMTYELAKRQRIQQFQAKKLQWF